MVEGLGIPVATVPETDGSLRIHPWHSSRAIIQIGWAALRLRYLASRTGAQLIHANSIRAGVAAILAARMGGPPVVVHVRDCLPHSGLADISRRLLVHSRSLLIVGKAVFTAKAARYDNLQYANSLKRLVDDLKLGDAVQFLGEREDIPEILRALDLLLLPSWHEPFGRSVAEAMAVTTPVVATDEGGPAEFITDNVDGILLAPRQPTVWAEAVDEVLRQPGRRLEIGRRGGITARRFGRSSHVAEVLSVYGEALTLN